MRAAGRCKRHKWKSQFLPGKPDFSDLAAMRSVLPPLLIEYSVKRLSQGLFTRIWTPPCMFGRHDHALLPHGGEERSLRQEVGP